MGIGPRGGRSGKIRFCRRDHIIECKVGVTRAARSKHSGIFRGDDQHFHRQFTIEGEDPEQHAGT